MGLRLIDKYPATLEGRKVAILVTDGADARAISNLRKAAEAEGQWFRSSRPVLAA